jgi:hypothetical protein
MCTCEMWLPAARKIVTWVNKSTCTNQNVCRPLWWLWLLVINFLIHAVAYSEIFFSGGGLHQEFFFGWGVQQIQLRIEVRENGELGAVAPYSGVALDLQMNDTHILIRLLRMFHGTGNSAQLWQNFGISAGFEPTPFGTPLDSWLDLDTTFLHCSTVVV